MKRVNIQQLDVLYQDFKTLPNKYYTVYNKKHDTEYNKMLKQKIDKVIMEEVLDSHFNGMREHNPEKFEELTSIFEQ